MAKNDDSNLENTHWNDFNILFLDFDGVLNSWRYVQDCIAENPEERNKAGKYAILAYLHPQMIQRTNKIIETINAKVVIHSSWRKYYDIDELRDILYSRGFIGEIIDVAPILKASRGTEIQAWLDRNNVLPERIVILDDLRDMDHLAHRHVVTSTYTGILDRHVQEAIGLFK